MNAPIIISYSFAETPFGKVIIASTGNGICHLSFCVSVRGGKYRLQKTYPHATLVRRNDSLHTQALTSFLHKRRSGANIRFRLTGTPFQIKVWRALRRIPSGSVTTYAKIARSIGSPNAVRAVGPAVGKNPVALIIPCHRVIRSNGDPGKYGFGRNRKKAILSWESVQRVFPVISI